jgi:hypothetical protein
MHLPAPAPEPRSMDPPQSAPPVAAPLLPSPLHPFDGFNFASFGVHPWSWSVLQKVVAAAGGALFIETQCYAEFDRIIFCSVVAQGYLVVVSKFIIE